MNRECIKNKIKNILDTQFIDINQNIDWFSCFSLWKVSKYPYIIVTANNIPVPININYIKYLNQ